ncbi:MAG: hypothetical protein ACLFSW_05280 [Halobacteriales archaeon]
MSVAKTESLARTGPRGLREVRRKEWIAGIFGGIAGVVNGGLFMSLGSGPLFEALGAVGVTAIFGTMAVAFPPLVCRFTNVFSYLILALAAEFAFVRVIASTLVSVFGLASATTAMAFIYVGGFWLIFGVFVLPIALGVSFPYLSFSFLFGCMAYALFLGGLYGIAVQDFL